MMEGEERLPDIFASREGRQSGKVEKEAEEMRTWEGGTRRR